MITDEEINEFNEKKYNLGYFHQGAINNYFICEVNTQTIDTLYEMAKKSEYNNELISNICLYDSEDKEILLSNFNHTMVCIADKDLIALEKNKEIDFSKWQLKRTKKEYLSPVDYFTLIR